MAEAVTSIIQFWAHHWLSNVEEVKVIYGSSMVQKLKHELTWKLETFEVKAFKTSFSFETLAKLIHFLRKVFQLSTNS
jgi:hypothetical protein